MKKEPKFNINDTVELITSPGVKLTVISNSVRDEGEVMYLVSGVGKPIRESELMKGEGV